MINVHGSTRGYGAREYKGLQRTGVQGVIYGIWDYGPWEYKGLLCTGVQGVTVHGTTKGYGAREYKGLQEVMVHGSTRGYCAREYKGLRCMGLQRVTVHGSTRGYKRLWCMGLQRVTVHGSTRGYVHSSLTYIEKVVQVYLEKQVHLVNPSMNSENAKTTKLKTLSHHQTTNHDYGKVCVLMWVFQFHYLATCLQEFKLQVA